MEWKIYYKENFMRDCLKTFITPASTSLFIGGMTAFTLFAASHTNNDSSSSSSTTTASAASQYIAAFANLAAKNAIVGLCVASSITTALFYTFIAKPAESLHKKCCATTTQENVTDGDDHQEPYNRI